jgi:hypothetical protein
LLLQIVWLWDGDDNDPGEINIVTVDGTHCKINEPRTQRSTGWYSHKSNGAGLAYELGIAIHQNKLVWINGPFPAGTHNDLSMYRAENGLKSKMPPGKKCIADRLYRNEPTITIRNPLDNADVSEFKNRAQARHETFNKKIKTYKILDQRFRHGVQKHKQVFEAVCVIAQYEMENGHPLFDV